MRLSSGPNGAVLVDAAPALPPRRRPGAGLGHGLLLAFAVGIAAAAKPPLPAPSPQAGSAPPPADVSAAELMSSARSEVRIIARENHRVEEYRVGNNVYKLKVTPKNAPPYYLIDQDGSGDLQWKRGPDLERDSVPHWALFKW